MSIDPIAESEIYNRYNELTNRLLHLCYLLRRDHTG